MSSCFEGTAKSGVATTSTCNTLPLAMHTKAGWFLAGGDVDDFGGRGQHVRRGDVAQATA